MYDLARDANFYLNSSIITYDGVPTYIEGVDEEFQALGVKLDSGDRVRFNVNEDKLVDLKPFKLGYLNYNGQAYYIARKPKRSWRQGLSKNNLSGSANWRLVCSQALVSVVQNKYPTFGVCLDSVSGGLCSSASFHRLFRVRGVDGELVLDYKERCVGKLNGGEVALKEEYDHLREFVREITA